MIKVEITDINYFDSFAMVFVNLMKFQFYVLFARVITLIFFNNKNYHKINIIWSK